MVGTGVPAPLCAVPEPRRHTSAAARRTRAWTTSDLPLLDAARQRLGDPETSRRKQRDEASAAAERERMESVVDDIIEADDGEGAVTMLHGQDAQNTLVDETASPGADPDLLAGPFAHGVVDEAQELTDADWQMLLLRSPTRSFTIVGDRAQARHGFTETWEQRLERIGLDHISTWLTAHADGIACVIGDAAFAATPRVRSLTPALSKGLEFDLVVLIDPETFGDGIEGAVDRYVAMTRATQQLAVLSS
jgi:DNA helicase IV